MTPMGRPQETPGRPLVKNLNTKISEPMMQFVDSARGNRSRARFVRDLIRAEANRKAGA